jgi:hypothetical protein
MAIPAAVITSLALAGYQTVEQKKAQSKAQEAQRAAEMEARRIQAEKMPMEESATLALNPLTGDNANHLDSLGLLVKPNKRKSAEGLGTTAGSTVGLGTTTGSAAGLGFGG